MLDLSTDIQIFLSSTFIDLQKIKLEVADRLKEVFGARMLIMETFGSDEAPPEVSSVRRVRESDIFVGIYARRYETIDRTTGKSITELELDEAERSLSAGNSIGILLYVLADSVEWPSDFCDKHPASVARQSKLKARIRKHTYTTFQNLTDLPFLVIRDVLSKIRSRLSHTSLQRRHLRLPHERKLNRPIGMEFLPSADRAHLSGRGAKASELLRTLNFNPITLLLGNSGSGKTSLIHAGLFPNAIDANWVPVYTRPLGVPKSDIVSGLLASVFQGPPHYRGALLTALEHAAAATALKRLLLVIDQFEDVLTAKNREETERLVADLRTINYVNASHIRLLLSYRADFEARLGRYWQLVSGSPAGLVRVYVPGISVDEAWHGITKACQDLRIKLELSKLDKYGNSESKYSGKAAVLSRNDYCEA